MSQEQINVDLESIRYDRALSKLKGMWIRREEMKVKHPKFLNYIENGKSQDVMFVENKYMISLKQKDIDKISSEVKRYSQVIAKEVVST